MKTISLSNRLSAAAGLIREKARVADVGCDHGKLSAFLLLSGKETPFVYATDIRPLPLQKAETLLNSIGMSDRCRCVLTDGLDGLPGEDIDDVVIAGLGADVISSIIKRADWLYDSSKRLILVPSSKKERLRVFLSKEGFDTLSENAVFEHGHYYSVMLVVFSGNRRSISLKEKWLGSIDCNDSAGAGYKDLVISRMKRIIESVPDPENVNRIEAEAFLEEIDDLSE